MIRALLVAYGVIVGALILVIVYETFRGCIEEWRR